MRDTVNNLGNNPLLAGVARVASILGTALATGAIWIFLQVWGDIKDTRDSVQKFDRDMASQSANVRMIDRRVTRLEDKVFP